MKSEQLRKELAILKQQLLAKKDTETNDKQKSFLSGQLDMIDKIYKLSKKP